jgi:hypothetical protein
MRDTALSVYNCQLSVFRKNKQNKFQKNEQPI